MNKKKKVATRMIAAIVSLATFASSFSSAPNIIANADSGTTVYQSQYRVYGDIWHFGNFVDGKISPYCIQHSHTLQGGEPLAQYGAIGYRTANGFEFPDGMTDDEKAKAIADYMNASAKIVNIIGSKAKVEKMGRICYWSQKLGTSFGTTQAALWEVTENNYTAWHSDEYNELASAVEHHKDKPSWNNETYSMTYDPATNNYKCMVYDKYNLTSSGNVQGYFNLNDLSKEGFTVTKKGSGYEISTSNTAEKTITLDKYFDTSDVTMGSFYWVAYNNEGYNYQRIAFTTDFDPVPAQITFAPEEVHDFTINKDYAESGTKVAVTDTLKNNTEFAIVSETSGGEKYVLFNGVNFDSVSNTSYSTSYSSTPAKAKISMSGATTADKTVSLTLKNLPQGDYKLYEIKAPSGYRPAEPVSFTVGNDNTSVSDTNTTDAKGSVELKKQWNFADGTSGDFEQLVDYIMAVSEANGQAMTKTDAIRYANDFVKCIYFRPYVKINAPTGGTKKAYLVCEKVSNSSDASGYRVTEDSNHSNASNGVVLKWTSTPENGGKLKLHIYSSNALGELYKTRHLMLKYGLYGIGENNKRITVFDNGYKTAVDNTIFFEECVDEEAYNDFLAKHSSEYVSLKDFTYKKVASDDNVTDIVEGGTGTSYNYERTIPVRVRKVDYQSMEGLAGAVFGLYSDEDCTNKLAEATSNGTGFYGGVINFKYWVKPDTTLYIKELSAPEGFMPDENVYKVNSSDAFYYDVTDAEPLEIANDLDLDRLMPYSNHNEYGYLFMTPTGKTQKFTAIPNYTWVGDLHLKKEYDLPVSESAEFKLTWVKPLSVADGDFTNTKDTYYDGFKDGMYCSQSAVGKSTTPAGAQLLVKTATTGTNGQALFEGLPFGYYELEEITPSGSPYVLRNPSIIKIDRTETSHEESWTDTSSSMTYYYTYYDTNYTYVNEAQNIELKIHKKDGKTSANLKDAEFTVYANKDFVVNGVKIHSKDDVIGVITTDENGYGTNVQRHAGDENAFDLYSAAEYRVVETKTPTGYVALDKDPIIVGGNYSSEIDKEYVTVEKTVNNEAMKGEITAIKRDNDTKVALAGAEFKLVADEDVVLSNGDVLYKKGSTIETKTTGKNGKATFDKVPTGYKYTVVEVKAPDNFTNKHEKKSFDLEDNPEVEFVTKSAEWFNDWQNGSISVFKTDGKTKKPLASAEFTLFASEDVKKADGTVLYKNGDKIATLTTGEDGKGKFDVDVPVGYKYTVEETKVPTGYKNNHDKQTFNLEYDREVEYVETEKSFENDSIDVAFSKRSIVDSSEVEGAKIEVKNSDNVVVAEWTSDKTDHIVEKMVAGDYTMTETYAPDGYVIATTIKFHVDDKGNVTTTDDTNVSVIESSGTPLIVMLDDTTKVEVSKKSITGDDELEGAWLQVVDKETGDIVDSWISTNKPHFIEGTLVAGKTYTLVETLAPNGYIISNEIDFVVNEDGTVTHVEMRDDTTKVEISKKSITGDDELEGATLQVIDKETGDIIDEWVSGKTPHQIVGVLTAGKTYTLVEIQTPAHYRFAENVDFTVSDTGIIDYVEMFDKYETGSLKLTKATTDNKNIEGIEFTLSGTSNIGLEVNMTKKTDENGEAMFEEVPTGTFTLSENGKTVKECYIVADDKEVAITVDNTTEVTVTNEEKFGELVVTKTAEGNTSVEGIEFTISGTSDSGREISLTEKTNAEGKITFSVPVGTYTVTENAETTPVGYICADEQSVTVAYAQTTNADFFNDVQRGTIVVNKRTEGMVNVEGIEFTLTGKSDIGNIDVNITGKTNENGELTFVNVPVGTYTVTENADTVPHAFAYMVADKQNVTVAYAKTSNVVFENKERTGEVTVQKSTEGNLNIEGITFVLYGTADNGREVEIKATTDKDGKAVFENIPIGTFMIKEDASSVKVTAYLVAEEQEVTVIENKTTNVDVTNTEKVGTLIVNKKTEGMKNIEGIEFVLEGKSDTGKEIKITAKTDKDGVAKFEGVLVGTYTLKEATEVKGYLVADEQNVTVVYAKETTVEVKNVEQSGSVKIQKQTATGKDVEGIEFTLEGTSDTGRDIKITAKTDKDGVALFENIPIGTYIIKESGNVPTGYLVADDQKVTVEYAKTTNVTFVNNKTSTGTPQTHDNPQTGVAGGSTATAAIAVATMILAKKRKREDDKEA